MWNTIQNITTNCNASTTTTPFQIDFYGQHVLDLEPWSQDLLTARCVSSLRCIRYRISFRALIISCPFFISETLPIQLHLKSMSRCCRETRVRMVCPATSPWRTPQAWGCSRRLTKSSSVVLTARSTQSSKMMTSSKLAKYPYQRNFGIRFPWFPF